MVQSEGALTDSDGLHVAACVGRLALSVACLHRDVVCGGQRQALEQVLSGVGGVDVHVLLVKETRLLITFVLLYYFDNFLKDYLVVVGLYYMVYISAAMRSYRNMILRSGFKIIY